MGYDLRAVIARTQLARAVAQALGPGTGPAPLDQGFALVSFNSEVNDRFAGPNDAIFGPFWWLGDTLAGLLARLSDTGPLAYVEAEYFGGTGSQHAVVWQHGSPVFGPISTEETEPLHSQGTAISRALRCLGVTGADQARDEFDLLGLGHHRHTQQWPVQAHGER